MNILVSACLLGTPCRYDGQSKPNENVLKLMEKHNLIPVCPEIFGGLSTPRPSAERVGSKVFSIKGHDLTENYARGAREVLRLARLYGADLAILKENSPACGSGKIHDGGFSGILTEGYGVCAEMLKDNGIKVIGESEIKSLF